jgi:PAS domain S-box-containing protein
VCGAAVVVLGFLPLIGWLANLPALTILGATGTIPMAPNTALSLIALGSAVCAVTTGRRSPGWTWSIRLAGAVVVVLTLSRVLELGFGLILGSDHWLVWAPAEVSPGRTPVGLMAAPTAATLCLAALALLLRTLPPAAKQAADLAGLLAVGVAALGLVFCLGYLYGAPFFSGDQKIPMALNSALGCTLLGVALAAGMGPEAAILRPFYGPSVASRLLRAFLPYTGLVVCVVSWLMYFASRGQSGTSAALLSAVLAVGAIFPVSFVCLRIARGVATALEQAQRELRESERKSRGYASDLERLTATLEERVSERTASLEQSREDLEQFFSITTSLQNPDNVERTFDLILGFCRRLGYERAMVSLIDRPANVIRAVKAAGSLEGIVGSTVRPLDSDDVLAVVAREGRTIVITDSQTDPRCDQASVAAASIRGQVIVPLVSRKEVIGTLQVASRAPLEPSVAEVRTLESLGSQAARALGSLLRVQEVQRLNAELHDRNRQLQQLADELAATAHAEREAREALRASEERTRSIVDAAYDAFVAMDDEGRIAGWNRQAELTFGWTREEAMGRLLEETIVPPRFRLAHREGLERYRATGTAPLLNRRIEISAVHRDEREFPVELTITRIPWGQGHLFSSFLHDITERKEAEEALRRTAESERQAHEELKKAQGQLVQSEKLAALGQLVAGVAHEINNPLSYVSNNVAVLQRDVRALRELLGMYQESEAILRAHAPDLAERAAALARRMDLGYTLTNLDGLMGRSRDGLKRIQQIVKDLRDFARLDESDLHDVDLNAGIESTVNIIQGQAKKQQVSLELALEPLPMVTCYPAKVNQVVLNLIANAIDATPSGGKVMVGTHAVEDHVEITVADTGSGIDPAIRDRIFDPFFTTKPQGKGTGLGLSISYGIVQGHGGTIDFESALGQGTRFRIRLPRKPRSGKRKDKGPTTQE